MPALRDWLAYTDERADPYPKTKLPFKPTQEERDGEWKWYERTKWKANLIRSMCIALLDWSERERADSAMDLILWAAAA